jgi:hypothetical protein
VRLADLGRTPEPAEVWPPQMQATKLRWIQTETLPEDRSPVASVRQMHPGCSQAFYDAFWVSQPVVPIGNGTGTTHPRAGPG